MLIVTNNKMLIDSDFDGVSVDYSDVDSLTLLYRIRDKIHKGWVILSHPLSGSIKPNENPYKSILIKEGDGKLDYKSLEIIENSIETFLKFKKIGMKQSKMSVVDEDYSLIDYTLISSCFK